MGSRDPGPYKPYKPDNWQAGGRVEKIPIVPVMMKRVGGGGYEGGSNCSECARNPGNMVPGPFDTPSFFHMNSDASVEGQFPSKSQVPPLPGGRGTTL